MLVCPSCHTNRNPRHMGSERLKGVAGGSEWTLTRAYRLTNLRTATPCWPAAPLAGPLSALAECSEGKSTKGSSDLAPAESTAKLVAALNGRGIACGYRGVTATTGELDPWAIPGGKDAVDMARVFHTPIRQPDFGLEMTISKTSRAATLQRSRLCSEARWMLRAVFPGLHSCSSWHGTAASGLPVQVQFDHGMCRSSLPCRYRNFHPTFLLRKRRQVRGRCAVTGGQANSLDPKTPQHHLSIVGPRTTTLGSFFHTPIMCQLAQISRSFSIATPSSA